LELFKRNEDKKLFLIVGPAAQKSWDILYSLNYDLGLRESKDQRNQRSQPFVGLLEIVADCSKTSPLQARGKTTSKNCTHQTMSTPSRYRATAASLVISISLSPGSGSAAAGRMGLYATGEALPPEGHVPP
jgi:hypothetical protein